MSDDPIHNPATATQPRSVLDSQTEVGDIHAVATLVNSTASLCGAFIGSQRVCGSSYDGF